MPRDSRFEEQVQPTRRRILVALKKSGGLTCNELANELGITSMGVRRHLITLERDGLVYHTAVQRGLGRPSHVYRLTELAEELFPKNYGALVNELLGYIEELDGEEKIGQLFQQRAQRRVERARDRLKGLSLADKVFELARILEEEGYLAEAEQLGEKTFAIREYNCAIRQVAQRFHQACGAELDFLRAVLPEAEVERKRHIVSGEPYCGYHITRRTDQQG